MTTAPIAAVLVALLAVTTTLWLRGWWRARRTRQAISTAGLAELAGLIRAEQTIDQLNAQCDYPAYRVVELEAHRCIVQVRPLPLCGGAPIPGVDFAVIPGEEPPISQEYVDEHFGEIIADLTEWDEVDRDQT